MTNQARAFEQGVVWGLSTLAKGLLESERQLGGRSKFDAHHLAEALAPALKVILEEAQAEAARLFPYAEHE